MKNEVYYTIQFENSVEEGSAIKKYRDALRAFEASVCERRAWMYYSCFRGKKLQLTKQIIRADGVCQSVVKKEVIL